MPKISFVIPSFNRVEWLALSINSLLAQTVQDVEVIVVDDASTDGTDELLKFYSDNERVKVITNPINMGAGASRNIGCEAASSEIIGVCDSDDVYIDTHAEMILKWFENNPNSELVNFPYVSIDYFEDPLESFNGSPFDHEIFKKDGSVSYWCNPSAAYKKKSMEEIGGYPKEEKGLTDDYQMLKNWVNAGKKVDFCGTDNGEIPFGVLHRILPDSMMSSIRGFDPKWLNA